MSTCTEERNYYRLHLWKLFRNTPSQILHLNFLGCKVEYPSIHIIEKLQGESRPHLIFSQVQTVFEGDSPTQVLPCPLRTRNYREARHRNVALPFHLRVGGWGSLPSSQRAIPLILNEKLRFLPFLPFQH